MTAAMTNAARPATADEARQLMASLPGSTNTQIKTEAELRAISTTLERLTEPASRQWISGRVMTVLAQYYVSSVPAEVARAVADDWFQELSEYPAWALQAACRWWMSAGNPDRRKKPLAGDIASRAHVEMGRVRVAQYAVRRFGRAVPAFMSHEAEANQGYRNPPPATDAERANRVQTSAEIVRQFTDRVAK